MKIFLYEFVTGGGGWSGCVPLVESLLAEARAMIRAMAADFAALDGADIVTTRDARLPEIHPPGCNITLVASSDEERAAIRRLASTADWTLLIAPETGEALLQRCRLVEDVGGRLLSPSAQCVEIATSKQRTAERLRRHGVRVPHGDRISGETRVLPRDLKFPVVMKPDDGCGSQAIELVRDIAYYSPAYGSPGLAIRVEEFIRGLPASVAVLCGPAGNYALPACQQVLSSDDRFGYRGGRLPLESRLDRRARALALGALAALPEPRGYFGVDLVLGEAEDGSGDYVIEINPRLTTSYVGLRLLARTNLAAAMLAVVSGRTPDLCFGNEQLEFTADGKVLSGADILVCQR